MDVFEHKAHMLVSITVSSRNKEKKKIHCFLRCRKISAAAHFVFRACVGVPYIAGHADSITFFHSVSSSIIDPMNYNCILCY